MYVRTPHAGQHAQSYVDSSGAQFPNCQDGGFGASKPVDNGHKKSGSKKPAEARSEGSRVVFLRSPQFRWYKMAGEGETQPRRPGAPARREFESFSGGDPPPYFF